MNNPTPRDAANLGPDLPPNIAAATSIDPVQQFLEQKEVYRQILDAIDDMILVKGAHSRIRWANKAFRDYYGMSNQQLRDIIDAPFNEAENTQQYVRDDHIVFSTGQTLNIPSETVIRHDGLPQLFNTIKTPIRDREGRIRLTVGVSRNITEKQRDEKELARYRERLENLVHERTQELHELSASLQVIIHSLVEGIIAVDAAGRVKLINPAAQALTGCPGESALGRPLPEILPLQDERTGEPLAGATNIQILDELAQPHGRLIARLPARPGAGCIVSLNISRLVGSDGAVDGSVLILRDITQEREAEDQRLRHQKLESLGLLAGGIAHDFNNILMGILGNLSLSRMQVEADSETAVTLERAEKACMHAQGLARQLLTFAKGGAPMKKVLRLETPLREAAELALRGSCVQLKMVIAPDLHPVEADEGQLGQAVNNLVLNAKQAMPGGGTVTLAIANATPAETALLPLAPGPYVRITVQDTGCGIPPEHLGRVFDPYFTTKEQGSGLGLPSVHSIVRRHGGHVTASSPPGTGASLQVFLPASPQAQVEAVADPRATPAGVAKELLILDDNVSVREVLQAMLTRLGHHVTVAASSAEAFHHFEKAEAADRPFAAIFIDLTMPGDLSGDEVIARLRARNCRAGIIAMSGYSTNPVMANYRELGLLGALPKPFDVQVLREVLARC